MSYYFLLKATNFMASAELFNHLTCLEPNEKTIKNSISKFIF